MTTCSDTQPATAALLEARALQPELRALLADRDLLNRSFAHFQNSFHEEACVDGRLLELCRARIDVLHGVTGRTLLDADTAAVINQGKLSLLSSVEQRAVAVAEQLAIDAHGVTTQQIVQLCSDLGEAATVALLTAVSMHDATIRMQRVLQPLAETQHSLTGAHWLWRPHQE